MICKWININHRRNETSEAPFGYIYWVLVPFFFCVVIHIKCHERCTGTCILHTACILRMEFSERIDSLLQNCANHYYIATVLTFRPFFSFFFFFFFRLACWNNNNNNNHSMDVLCWTYAAVNVYFEEKKKCSGGCCWPSISNANSVCRPFSSTPIIPTWMKIH